MSYRSWCINVFIKALWINGEDQLINLSLTRARVVRRMWERDSRPWPATGACRTLGEVQMKWLCRFPTSQWLNCSQSFKTSLLPSTPPAPPPPEQAGGWWGWWWWWRLIECLIIRDVSQSPSLSVSQLCCQPGPALLAGLGRQERGMDCQTFWPGQGSQSAKAV